jgi:hypothetical protein
VKLKCPIKKFIFGENLTLRKMKNQYIIILAAALFGSVTLASCDKDDDNDDGSCIQDHCIGDSYQGGIIFYLDGLGGGLISAPTDQASAPEGEAGGAEWGEMDNNVSGASGTALGTGYQNTIDIEAGCTTSGTAADICANLTLGGYNDWFLPSKDELKLMYQNICWGNGELGNVGGFQRSFYWSSSEAGASNAWRGDFNQGGRSFVFKDFSLRVRAVRAF